MKKIVFFGGVGSPTQFGGELTKNKEIIARLRELGCDVTVLDSFNSRSNKKKLLKILSRFFANIVLHPKATYIFSTSFGNIYPLFKILYCLPIKRHIVHWVIGGQMADRVADGTYHSKYLKVVNLTIVEGTKMVQRMESLGFSNVVCEPNFKTIGTLPKVRKKDDGKIHFVFLSRITADKGCRYIFQSVEELNRKGFTDKFVVDFYGNVEDEYRWEFEKAIEDTVNANYCGSLQLLDDCNYDVLAVYHYMLFPTYWAGEGFPGVVIDAYKAGVPIIASDWNLNKEFIMDGKTGVIVPTHSVEKLTGAMKKAIIGEYDNVLMSENCQREVAKYDTRNVINQQLLDKLLAI